MSEAEKATGTPGYRHEALLYAGHDEFMAATLPFVRGALAAREPVLVLLADIRIRALKEALGGDAGAVRFANMAEVGANPGRIIPAWEEFVSTHARDGRHLWGIGEPISPQLAGAELAECERHEQLLNHAFADPGFTLLCPYDTSLLAPEVIEHARHSHPFVTDRGHSAASADYAGVPALASHDRDPLGDPPPGVPARRFDAPDLQAARAWVAGQARDAGLSARRIHDLLLAFSEVATNSVRHGGGGGCARVWRRRGGVICEVRDRGHIEDPLAGRRRPRHGGPGGRGLWIANQVADLLQLRSCESGTVVRIHVHETA